MVKAQLILRVLATGRHVLISDVDVIWLADPKPILLTRHPADVMVRSHVFMPTLTTRTRVAARDNSSVECATRLRAHLLTWTVY